MRTMTKKPLLIAAMLSFTLCGYAQKGEKGIGANFGLPGIFRFEYMENLTDKYQDCPNCHAPLKGKCHSCGGTGRK